MTRLSYVIINIKRQLAFSVIFQKCDHVAMLECLINKPRSVWGFTSIQPTMTEVADDSSVKFCIQNMDACYETFDKDGCVSKL